MQFERTKSSLFVGQAPEQARATSRTGQNLKDLPLCESTSQPSPIRRLPFLHPG